jgi:V8-like Glu-specific endopeptidase
MWSFSDQDGSKNGSSDDQRLPLDLTTDLPLKAVGRIGAALPNRQYYGCTGSFIARNLVLTAAHCVLNDDGSTRSENVRFFSAAVRTPGCL